MDITIKKDRVKEIMGSFYALTGITLVLISTKGKTILKYPEENNVFCSCMKAGERTRKLCIECDEKALDYCRIENTLHVYHCHAGLLEACTPLFLMEEVVGYLMLGQIIDDPEKTKLGRRLVQYMQHNCKDGLEEILKKDPERVRQVLSKEESFASEILYCTKETIHAATVLMNACSAYLISEKNIQKKKINFVEKLDEYLELHLSEPVSVQQICRYFGIGRTSLYELCNQILDTSIGDYIQKFRFMRAKEMIMMGKDTIPVIAGKCGYSDPEYFCRVFKKETGISARKYLERIREE